MKTIMKTVLGTKAIKAESIECQVGLTSSPEETRKT